MNYLSRFSKLIVFLLIALAVFTLPSNRAEANTTSCDEKRIIVVMIDDLKWGDIGESTPNLKKVLEKSYIASLSPGRTSESRSELSYYTTISAGTRTYDKGESVSDEKDENGNYSLGIDDVIATNKDASYNASIGLLGEALQKNNVANAIIEETESRNSYVLTSDPKGNTRNIFSNDSKKVDDLLNRSKKSVLFAHLPNVNNRLTDKEFSDILRRFSVQNTEVMILGTHDFNGPENLKVAALNSGNQLGTLSSGTRQRDGLIELVDIAPTILSRLCIKSNLDYEGSFVSTDKSDSSFTSLKNDRIDENNNAKLRKESSGNTSLIFIGFSTILLLLVIAFKYFKTYEKYERRAITYISTLSLAFFFSTFFVNAFEPNSLSIWLLSTGGLSIAISTVLHNIKLTKRKIPEIFAFTFITMMIVDLIFNNLFQANAALGYSFITNSRSYGFSNFASAAFSASLIYLTYIYADKFRYKTAFLIVSYAIGLLVIGYPKLGADVGGALSSAPSFIASFLLITKTKVKIARVAIYAAICSLLVLIFGYIDYLRPKNERTHLGRLFNDVHHKGLGTLYEVLIRKMEAMLSTFASNWLIVALLMLACIYLSKSEISISKALLFPIAMLAFFGTFLNDAGVLVGATVLILSFATAVNSNKSINDQEVLV